MHAAPGVVLATGSQDGLAAYSSLPLFAFLGSQIVVNELPMLLIRDVQLGLVSVFELRMLDHGNGNVRAAPQDEAVSVQLRLVTIDAEAA